MALSHLPVLGAVGPRVGASDPAGAAFLAAAGRTASAIRKRSSPTRVSSSWGGGGGSGGGLKRDEGVEDTNAGMEELLARSQKRLLVEVRPPPEWRLARESARSKARQMLFQAFCQHFDLAADEVEVIWRGGGLEEKVGVFLVEWGSRHRPLSLKAALELLEEHMSSVYGRRSRARNPPPGGLLGLLLRAFGRSPLQDIDRERRRTKDLFI
ncbi:uncharacterized protein LOC144702465 [Wolffia australiana]